MPPSAPTATTVMVLAPSTTGTSAVKAPPMTDASTACPPAATQTDAASVEPATVTVGSVVTAPATGSVTVRLGPAGSAPSAYRSATTEGVAIGRPASIDCASRTNAAIDQASGVAEPVPSPSTKPAASGWSQTCSGIMYPSLAVAAERVEERRGRAAVRELVLAPLTRRSGQRRPTPVPS